MTADELPSRFVARWVPMREVPRESRGRISESSRTTAVRRVAPDDMGFLDDCGDAVVAFDIRDDSAPLPAYFVVERIDGMLVIR